MRRKGANNTYWGNIWEGLSSLLEGLRLSWKHLLEARQSRKPIGVANEQYFEQATGIVTLQYPFQSLPVPDNGRYRLHNEIEDCIVCDKCAKICPVNCIEIEPVRAVEEIGKTSDGSSKRIYPAKFDIDMGKCCFCGLCTTVCPTECLTMTKDYDFTEFDVADHNYSFSEMTPLEILEKKKELEAFTLKKEQAREKAKTPEEGAAVAKRPGAARPKIGAKPSITAPKPDAEKPADEAGAAPEPAAKSKPVYRPKAASMRPKVKPADATDKPAEGAAEEFKPAAKPKPIYRLKAKPVIKPKAAEEDTEKPTEAQDPGAEPKPAARPKPVYRPKAKPVIKPRTDSPQEAARKIMEEKKKANSDSGKEGPDQNSSDKS